HTIVSIKNDGHYFCRAGGNRPDGLNEPVTKGRCLHTEKTFSQQINNPQCLTAGA
ncbi:phage terminase large subunit family protein, partial [Salmonella enterica subsp. enterica serovar Kentucky]|nr:phage terminase large subunit family protein [Salmonella enterica subsp. enterica serovar Kentucky]